MRRRFVLFALIVVVVLTSYVAGCASAPGQPHMNAALDELRAAKSELDSANTDKGGHRAKAVSLVDEAIAEVEAGIDYARSH